MLFDSALTRDDFHRLYGVLPRERVLLYECPRMNIATNVERQAARRRWIGDNETRLVVGYLGGLNERKGYRRIERALRDDNFLFLLMGGQYSKDYVAPGLEGRMKAVGLVKDTDAFYAACDVLIVPSYYEAFGLVTYEAAVRGLPVIVTPEVGALPHLKEFGAGLEWQTGRTAGTHGAGSSSQSRAISRWRPADGRSAISPADRGEAARSLRADPNRTSALPLLGAVDLAAAVVRGEQGRRAFFGSRFQGVWIRWEFR